MRKQDGGVATPSLRRLVVAAVKAGTPLGPEAAPLLAAASGQQLFEAFRGLDLHDYVLRPPPAMAAYCRRDDGTTRRIGLADSLRRKINGRRPKPGIEHVLTQLRLQSDRLLEGLPDMTARRVRHVLQVQLCPAGVKEQMVGLLGLTYSTSRQSIDVGDGPCRLDSVRAQWVESVRQVGRGVKTLFKEGHLVVDPDTLQADIVPDLHYDFHNVPKFSGAPPVIPIEKTVSVENGLACHQEIERVACIGSPALFEACVRIPQIFVATDDPAEFPFEKTKLFSHGLQFSAVRKLKAWFEGVQARSLLNPPPPPPPGSRTDPHAWVRFLLSSEAMRIPLYKTTNWDGYASQMEEADDEFLAEGFLSAVWKSDMIEHSHWVLLPLENFHPDDPHDPVRVTGGRLFARFTPDMLGRNWYRGGVLQRLPLTAKIQVLARRFYPDPE